MSKIERRKLRFNNIDEILAEARILSSAPWIGVGNWSLGQVCDHLGSWMIFSIDGVPLKLPSYVRVMGRLIKRRMLKHGLPAGHSWKGEAAALLFPQRPISTEDGLIKLGTAIQRLKSETQRAPSPLFGPLSIEEWNQLHCRHAELHLSFIQPSI